MQIFVIPQKVAGDLLIFGDTNISPLNSMGQHFHSLLSSRRVLNKEANNLLTLGLGIYVNNVTTFPWVSSHFLKVAQIHHTHACTSKLPREGREGPPAAVFSLLLTQNLATVRQQSGQAVESHRALSPFQVVEPLWEPLFWWLANTHCHILYSQV